MNTLSTASLLAIAGFLFKSWINSRRLGIDENKDKRLGYDEFIGLLSKDLIRARAEHADCNGRLDEMQREIFTLQKQILALTLRYSIPVTDVPEAVRSALESVANLLAPGASQ